MARAPSCFLLTLAACCLDWASASDNGTAANATNSTNLTLPNGSMPQVHLPTWKPIDAQDQTLSAIKTLDLLENQSWDVPFRVMRCPVNQAPALTPIASGGLHLSISYNMRKMYSIVEGSLPVQNLSEYHGIELVFTSIGLPTFKVRLQDNNQIVRFIASVKVVDGRHSLWLNWNDFHGEKMVRAGINPCKDDEPCRNITSDKISAIALLMPMGKESSWVGNFTLHSIRAAVLGAASAPTESNSESGSGNDTKTPSPPPPPVITSSSSVSVKDSSEAESILFREENMAVGDAAERTQDRVGCVLAVMVALGVLQYSS